MKKLSDNQIKAAHLIASGMKSKDVASAVNVTPETISTWKRIPTFEAYYNGLREEVMTSSLEKLRGLFGKAVDTVGDHLDASKSDMVRLKAAQVILRVFVPTDGRSRAAHCDTGESNANTLEDEALLEKLNKQLEGFSATGSSFWDTGQMEDLPVGLAIKENEEPCD